MEMIMCERTCGNVGLVFHFIYIVFVCYNSRIVIILRGAWMHNLSLCQETRCLASVFLCSITMISFLCNFFGVCLVLGGWDEGLV